MENKKPDFNRIAITGIGLTTSVGLSALTSLAAIRGVIANFSEHETVLVNGDEYGTELSGAKIARLPENVVSRSILGEDRAIALLAPAIRECADGLSADLLRSAKWRISSRIELGFEKFANILKEKFHDLPIPALHRHNTSALALGRCLFFEDIIQATTELRSGSCQMVLVGCVDSLCETTVLGKLCEADRLKSGTNPEGIIAGEAAGVILLELESSARIRKATILAYISAWGQAVEPHPFTGKTRSRGKGLSNAYREAFAQLPEKGEEIDMVVADLNGEHARAYEWGLTEGRIFPPYDKMRKLKHPADCVGDCGAAMGPVLLATAVGHMSEAFPVLSTAISTSDDGGARRVLCLEKGDGRDKGTVIRNGLKKSPIAIPTVIDQHTDEVSFLWISRNRLMKSQFYGLYELAGHDERIEAHLDGLRLAGSTGWEMCETALSDGNAGDYFSASILAFKSGDEDRLSCLLDKGGPDPVLSRGIISALGWLPYSQAKPYITRFISEHSPYLLRIGIAASAIHRIDPGKILKDAIQNDNHALKARSLKAAGELGRIDLLPILEENLSHGDESCRFFAAWSAALLGDMNALPVLQSLAASSAQYKEDAVKMAFRIMESQNALKWHAELAADPETTRQAVIGAGTIGDPALISWLIVQMKTPALSRVAGEAFTMISGADIESDGLKGKMLDGFEVGPSEDPEDDNVGMDDDEDLPWLDPELAKEWWQQRRDKFNSGVRYFLGKSISDTHLHNVLCSGSQRQRAHAAIESILLNPGLPLFEIRTPGFRQMITLKGQI